MTSGSAAHNQAGTDYRVSVAPLLDSDSLKTDWLALQSRSKPPFFLSWLWISCWLDSYSPNALVLRVTQSSGQLIALGIFVTQAQHRHKLLRSNVALLHQTGLAHEDQIWVEYNGLLTLPGHETSALALAVKTLQQQDFCDEVHLSMLQSAHVEKLSSLLSGVHVEYQVAGFQTDLKSLRDQSEKVIESLSSNSRHQVRRSLRLYEEAYGKAKIVPAQSAEDAVAMFHEAGEWHRSRWADSGYNNRDFVMFHETLIKRGFGHESVQLFRIVFGEHVIGVFYFLLLDGCAYFYLQGLRSELNNKLKPGLNAHCLLMQYFLEQGYDVYDFMGGESQYKHQLSNQQSAFTTVRTHNGQWRFLLEQRARRLKHRLLGKQK